MAIDLMTSISTSELNALLNDSKQIPVPSSDGVTVQDLGDCRGMHVLYVRCQPFSNIPMHTHTCASGMGITKGRALATKEQEKVTALPGDFIYKSANTPHGFEVGEEGLEFFSLSDKDGILNGNSWDFDVL